MHKKLHVLMLVIATIVISGCNAFEAFDHASRDSDYGALEVEASLFLGSGNYSKAHEIYNRIISENGETDSALRGRAQSKAALAGFNKLAVLNMLQNTHNTPGVSAAIFDTAKQINSTEKLEMAISDFNQIKAHTNSDLLIKSLLSSFYACKILLNEYDTNKNQQLDSVDRIGFRNIDEENWPEIYSKLTNDNPNYSLELAFVNLVKSLQGRGDEWSFISPVNERKMSVKITKANRNIILAVEDFAQRLMSANDYFGVSESEFVKQIINLDSGQ